MQLNGEIISFNAHQRRGYIYTEGYPEILYRQIDLPLGYILPNIGEKLSFTLNDKDGNLFASDITRPEIQVTPGYKAKLKAIQHHLSMLYLEQPKSKRKQIWMGAIAICVLSLALLVYAISSTFQEFQQNKTQQFQLVQQQAIEQQRAELGEIAEPGLSEEARRNLDAKVYGTVRERSATVTAGIDKLNGLQPASSGKFKCDERKFCHEMRTYSEALYFQKHCRGARLDNNGNGIPCENDIRWIKKD